MSHFGFGLLRSLSCGRSVLPVLSHASLALQQLRRGDVKASVFISVSLTGNILKDSVTGIPLEVLNVDQKGQLH